MSIQIEKKQHWNKLIDYYYDNIHWDTQPSISIYEWLERDYGGETALSAKYIHFKKESDATWFLLRWT
jgi:hypothetical protein